MQTAVVPTYLARDCEKCLLCVGAHKALIHPRGSNTPRVLLVGEAPGQQEDAVGVPFIGASGKLLDAMLAEAGAPLEDVRWTNTVRCVPLDKGRITTPPEIAIRKCLPYLIEEIEHVKPSVIVCLGATAARALLMPPDAKTVALARLRGKTHAYKTSTGQEIPVVVTYHPAYVLRGSKEARAHIVSDLQRAVATYRTPVREQKVTAYSAIKTTRELSLLVSTLLEQWHAGKLQHGCIAVDLETSGLYPFKPSATIVSVQVAWADGRAALIPVCHASTDGSDRAEWLAAVHMELKRLLESGIPVAGHNFQFDYKWLYAKFGITVKTVSFDTMLAHNLLVGGVVTSRLDYMTAAYLGFTAYKSEMADTLAKGKMAEAPLDALVAYGCRDADGTLQLVPIMQRKLREAGRYNTFSLLCLDTWRTLAHMEIDGAQLSPARMGELAPVYKARIADACAELRGLPAHATWSAANRKENPKRVVRGKVNQEQPEWLYPALNPNAPGQIKSFLYETLGVSKQNAAGKTDESTGEKRLIEIGKATYGKYDDVYRACRAVLRARHAQTKLSRYVDKLVAEIQNKGAHRVYPMTRFESPNRRWLVHASFNLTGAATGRLSSSDPNMQNIPRGSDIRSAFVSRFKYGSIFKADFSQMELRVLAALSKDPVLLAVLVGTDPRYAEFSGDVHLFVASKVLGKPKEKVTKEERHRAKAVSFGIIYGRGARAIALEYGMTEQQAQSLVDDFLNLFPGVAAFVHHCHKEVRNNGVVYSPLGRIYPLPDGMLLKGKRSLHPDLDTVMRVAEAERQSVNYPIQGSASDIGLVSLVSIRKQLVDSGLKTRPFAFVHDSIESDMHTPELFSVYRIKRDTMLGNHGPAFDWMTAPLKVEFEWGRDWQGTMVCDFDGRVVNLAGHREHYERLRPCIAHWFTIEQEEVVSGGVKNDRTKEGAALKNEDLEDAADYEKVTVSLKLKENHGG